MRSRRAARWYGIRDLRLERLDIPAVGPHDVLVRVACVGICGSDMHYYSDGHIGDSTPQPGHILGHEAAGDIVAIGEDVETKRVGDRIALEPGVPCGCCEYCRTGRYNLCPNMIFRSQPDPYPRSEGALTEYLVTPEDFAHLIPQTMSFEEAALMEPLSVALHATKRGRIGPGDTVAVWGSGPVGLLSLQCARIAGATQVISIDVVAGRLALAARLGADATVDGGKEGVIQAVLGMTGGSGADVVIEASGSAQGYLDSASIVKPGGRIVLVGSAIQTKLPLQVAQILSKELDVVGVWRYCNCYPRAINLTATGRVDVGTLITHRFSLDQVTEAFECAYEKRDGAVKVMINLT